MTATRDGLPEGRYGRSADARSDARTDRTLKIVGAVLGTVILALVAWSGVAYVSGQDVSGELIKFKVVSDTAVEVHLEVHKDADTDGVCTVRAQSADGGDVGWKDLRVTESESRISAVGSIRTTRRAAAVELIGCKAVGSG